MKQQHSVENYFSNPKLRGNAIFQTSFTLKYIHGPATAAIENRRRSTLITLHESSQDRGTQRSGGMSNVGKKKVIGFF